ncbi:molybdopterin molybdenumtransferase MoeA [Putridiphycobacter roseus]|uniref:Molybdopterin molybdenumtransferase n=1 Tax=Putridiphycobacter roseus TaxID=2219161 RepID=A0A2W1NCK6_9FLAO|nr:gephyrin-like molybdotransferase Glp [Putridiphycobacter roseus]PZE17105.1 molybdopterin molybdenumtransferase MoeA [Putridiphycobacter roseus]
MITVEEALSLVEAAKVSKAKVIEMPLLAANGWVLAETIYSPMDMPPFPQSAMDGYAIHYVAHQSTYKLIGEIAAGESVQQELIAGEAARIFTGAPVPSSANMVIRQEDAQALDGKVIFTQIPKLQANIRPEGEQIKKNAIALHAGHLLQDGSIGFLASLGVEKVNVIPKPSIAIISTGNELVEAGTPLKFGQIYESNVHMLQSALSLRNIVDVKTYHIKDDLKHTVDTLKFALERYDLIIFSGGISVGDYDYVKEALTLNQVETLFYKVKQKPGKPLYFGKKGAAFIFGLPGNPAACLTGFYIYILPLIAKLSGKPFVGLSKSTAPLNHAFERKGDRALFLKAKVDQFGKVDILDGQSSAMLQAFANANALVYVGLGQNKMVKGEDVVLYHL